MLTIKEKIDPAFVPASGLGMIFEARSGDELLGVCRFSVDRTKVTVVGGACDDSSVLDGLVRAGLFAAMDRGAEVFECAVPEPELRALLDALGIPARGRLDLFFSGGCKGGCTGDCTSCRG
ncbi:MAG: hypothetical protein RR197_03815 [Oscillospiraceae bacterium]